MIIGLLVVITVAFVLMLQTSAPKPVVVDTGMARSLIQSCLETSLHDAITFVAGTGGYAVRPTNAIDIGTEFVVIERDAQGDSVPPIDSITPDIAGLTVKLLTICADPQKIQALGFNVERRDSPQVTVDAKPGKVTATLTWDMTISKGNFTQQITQMTAADNFPLLELRDDAATVAASITDDAIDLGMHESLGSNITYLTQGPGTILFRLNRGSATFAFAVILTPNNPPYAPSPVSLVMHTDDRRTVKIEGSDPDGDPITYSVDSPFSTIEQDGTLTVTAASEGTYEAIVTITDNKEATWKINIPIQIT
jgi:hypothetical protein